MTPDSHPPAPAHLPPGLRRVPCQSNISRLIKEGKKFGGAEGEMQRREQYDIATQSQASYQDILIPKPQIAPHETPSPTSRSR